MMVEGGVWLARDVPLLSDRVGLMRQQLTARGWRLRVRRRRGLLGGHSWVNPLTLTVHLRPDWVGDTAADAAVLAHELAHVEQIATDQPDSQRPTWRRRIGWALRAIFDRAFVLGVEMEAEAHEAAVGRLHGWWPAVRALGGRRLLVRDDGGRWRWNLGSFTPGDPWQIEELIALRTEDLWKTWEHPL
jgi:hypothetical protein